VYLIRYEVDGRQHHGVLEDGEIAELDGDFFGDLNRTGRTVALSDVIVKCPTAPSKIINLAGNYLSHMGERPPFNKPQPFIATPSSALDPNRPIQIPAGAVNVHYEGEMAVIIGRRARDVSQSDARNYVLGVCAANDVSERDWQGGGDKDVQWWRAKSADTFSPFGPWIATGLDYANLDLATRLNGETVQSCNTSELIFGVDEIIEFVTRYMTLEPGDVIFTGTSGETSRISAGVVVEVELEGCGALSNPVE
jgi:2-keto-4-pentenoate hydratase/2-oxohepta-3-ene-1,7-dioic acid hydratase in catechol pathway